jgi:hypothetical protein
MLREMPSVRFWCAGALVGLLLAAAPRQRSATAATERETTEIVKRAQTLFDGLAPGDVALWRDALTEDAVLIDEFGRRQTKAETLREMRPLPGGFSGSIEVRHPNVHFYPATPHPLSTRRPRARHLAHRAAKVQRSAHAQDGRASARRRGGEAALMNFRGGSMVFTHTQGPNHKEASWP